MPTFFLSLLTILLFCTSQGILETDAFAEELSPAPANEIPADAELMKARLSIKRIIENAKAQAGCAETGLGNSPPPTSQGSGDNSPGTVTAGGGSDVRRAPHPIDPHQGD